MKPGQQVEIEFYDQRKPGKVVLASDNGISLMLEFDGLLGGHVNHMPVLLGLDGKYRSVMSDQPVTIRLTA